MASKSPGARALSRPRISQARPISARSRAAACAAPMARGRDAARKQILMTGSDVDLARARASRFQGSETPALRRPASASPSLSTGGIRRRGTRPPRKRAAVRRYGTSPARVDADRSLACKAIAAGVTAAWPQMEERGGSGSRADERLVVVLSESARCRAGRPLPRAKEELRLMRPHALGRRCRRPLGARHVTAPRFDVTGGNVDLRRAVGSGDATRFPALRAWPSPAEGCRSARARRRRRSAAEGNRPADGCDAVHRPQLPVLLCDRAAS